MFKNMLGIVWWCPSICEEYVRNVLVMSGFEKMSHLSDTLNIFQWSQASIINTNLSKFDVDCEIRCLHVICWGYTYPGNCNILAHLFSRGCTADAC